MIWKIKRFEDLTGEELYKILRLRSSVFVLEQECIYQDCDEKDLKAYHLFCTYNDKVITTLRILDKGVSYDEVSIGRVAVDREYRRNSLGRKAMEKAISFIKDTYGETEVRISAQLYIKDFYKSLGFKEISEEYL